MLKLLLYGASGYTGELLARAARRVGLAPILAGRTQAKLGALAAELNLPFRVFGLERASDVDAGLVEVGIVLNAAGPFSSTAGPLIEACLRAGAHYLDISGEVSALERAACRDAEARRRGVMLLPGVGFDVVPSDCLAAHVSRRLENPKRLSIGISGLRLTSRGSAVTMIDQLAAPVWVRRRGALVQIPPTSEERAFDYGAGPAPSLAVSWGDVVSSYYSTGIPDVIVYFEATPAVRMHNTLVRAFVGAITLGPWQAFLRAGAPFLPRGPTSDERARNSAVIVAEVEDDHGGRARSRLRCPEAYTLTAEAGSAIAARVLDGHAEPGFQTPSRIFGPDFVLTLPGVSRENL
jgi:short subunit dehydrogenase-like uncharacterized protein